MRNLAICKEYDEGILKTDSGTFRFSVYEVSEFGGKRKVTIQVIKGRDENGNPKFHYEDWILPKS